MQLHWVQIAADTPPGDYDLAIGIYNRHDMQRLPVVVDGAEVSDHLLLEGLKVTDK